MSSDQMDKNEELINPNVRPSEPYSKRMTGPLFEPKQPILSRLAKVAAPKKTQPIAGWVGIQRSKEPEVDVPPECMLYENDFFKFQLGKMPKHRDYPHKDLVDVGPDSQQKNLESGIEALAISTFQEALELANEQKRVDPVPTKGKVRDKSAKGRAKKGGEKTDVPKHNSSE